MRLRPTLLLSCLLAAACQRATLARAPLGPTSGGLVSGTVRDSASRAPLAGALVQLVSADPGITVTRATRSDPQGGYRIDSVPPGRYSVGFLHDRLDSLGMQAPVRLVTVREGRVTRFDLVSPAARVLRATYCPGQTTTGAVVIGVVRSASDRMPVANAEVVGEWLEFVMSGTALRRQQPALYARTADDGGYVLCNVPLEGSVFVSANIGADTTDRIELLADRSGVMRRDLYVGPVRSTTGDGTPAARRQRAGDGALRGSVRTADGDQPLPNAMVRIVDGPQVRTNARGEWTLAQVPDGTRVLEVRALGYYPVSQPVDVLAGTPRVRIAMMTFQSVLDTVRVVAARDADRSGGGFARRSRSLGAGSFVDAAQIRARGGVTTTDIFRSMNGVRLDGVGYERTILLRGAFGECAPSVYVDGLYMAKPTADEIDLIAPRQTITAIEVYAEGTTPAEFARALDGCGAIVIWTRPVRQGRRPR